MFGAPDGTAGAFHKKKMKIKSSHILAFGMLLVLCCGCSLQRKIRELCRGEVSVSLALSQAQDFIPDIRKDTVARRDTLTIQDGDRTILIMKAVKDEDGEMVAHDVIDAAIVQARFRNIAERHGKVDIQFQVIVPERMQDRSWQLRFQPMMHIMEDTVALERVIITGEEYRRVQLRGYQQYEKFISSIITDSTRFVNMRLLDIFIQRNIPELYAFKSDTTLVSDEQFSSAFGVTEQEAVDHYTNRISKRMNSRRAARKEKMYRKYVKSPIVTEGIRLDTVICGIDGDFIYNYTETIRTRPKLRRVDVVLLGDIYQEDRRIYTMPSSEPLTFYISSLSAFVDNTEKYINKIIHRRVEENTACYVEFTSASHEVCDTLGHNGEEIGRIKSNLRQLMCNEQFDLDSIVVLSSASPEGELRYNERLSKRRSESISRYFEGWMQHVADSINAERGFSVDEEGNVIVQEQERIPLLARSGGENWRMLDELVARDTLITDEQKEVYGRLSSIKDLDRREAKLKNEPFYGRMRKSLYPRLRTTRFDFYLHRKGMVKDTVHTTEIDTVYMTGVQAIRDRDYEKAIILLGPYKDYNTAIAYVSMDYNASAMAILKDLKPSPQVDYMLALLYSRQDDDQKAVEHYMRACKQEPGYIHRGNLDPEIAALIKRYGLNKQEEDEFDYSF